MSSSSSSISCSSSSCISQSGTESTAQIEEINKKIQEITARLAEIQAKKREREEGEKKENAELYYKKVKCADNPREYCVVCEGRFQNDESREVVYGNVLFGVHPQCIGAFNGVLSNLVKRGVIKQIADHRNEIYRNSRM